MRPAPESIPIRPTPQPGAPRRAPNRSRMASTLELVLLYLAAAIAGVVAFRMLRLLRCWANLVAGVLIGPNAARTGARTTPSAAWRVRVVFLMFVIGLDFNLPQAARDAHAVFGLGASQVVLTIVAHGRNLLLAWISACSALLGAELARPAAVLGARWRCRAPRWSSS